MYLSGGGLSTTAGDTNSDRIVTATVSVQLKLLLLLYTLLFIHHTGKLLGKTITTQRTGQLRRTLHLYFKRFFVLTCYIRAFSLKMFFTPQNVYNIQNGIVDNL